MQKIVRRDATNAKMLDLKLKLKEVDVMMVELAEMKKRTGWTAAEGFPIWFHLKIFEKDPFLKDLTAKSALYTYEGLHAQYNYRVMFLWGKFMKL